MNSIVDSVVSVVSLLVKNIHALPSQQVVKILEFIVLLLCLRLCHNIVKEKILYVYKYIFNLPQQHENVFILDLLYEGQTMPGANETALKKKKKKDHIRCLPKNILF